MVHWWELWSPGLQAIGGVVELAGAGLLAYEWFIGEKANKLQEKVTDINKEIENLPEIKGDLKKAPIGMLVNELILEMQLGHWVRASRDLPSRRRVYLVGFVILILGVIFQVTANGIGWAGAYGLFN
jgi:hypothetical protein